MTKGGEAHPLVSDEQLMERLLDGQDQALDMLVKRYLGPLYAFAHRMVGSKSAAEDAFQETFLKVYRKRRSFQEGAKFRPWVYQICLNVCRDQLRKGKRRQEVPLVEETAPADSTPGPAEQAEKALQAERVKKAISQLPRKQREVLVLSQYEGLTYEEIGDTLNIPTGTVKSRNYHAIRNLAKLLQK